MFRSELAARFLRVEMAWHWISSLSVDPRRSTNGFKNPASIMGDSFIGWIEIFRMQATADRMSGRYDD